MGAAVESLVIDTGGDEIHTGADLLAFELGNSSGVVVDGSGVIGRGGESISAGDGFRILIGEAEPVPKSAQRRTSQQDNNNKLWLH